MSTPLSPFDRWPDQWVDEATGLRAWFIAPRFVVLQFRQPVFTHLAAAASVRVVDQVLATLRPQLRAAGGLVMVNDLRACDSVERDAQLVISAAWKRLSPEDLAEAWVLKGAMGFFAMMVLRMVNRVAALATGKVQQVVDGPAELLARYPLAPPAPGAPFPGTTTLTSDAASPASAAGLASAG